MEFYRMDLKIIQLISTKLHVNSVEFCFRCLIINYKCFPVAN